MTVAVRAERVAAAVLGTGTAAIGLVLAWVALVVPYHLWDALAFGNWSRLIATTGDLHIGPDAASLYQRPLFYVTQGALWRVIGVDERAGRLLALIFAVALAASVAALAARAGGRVLAAAAAVAVLFGIADFASLAISGLSDVPAAAAVGALGIVTLRDSRSWRSVAAIVLAAAVTGLAKPTTLSAVAGVALAAAILRPGPWQDWLRRTVVPIAAGALLAIAWFALEARYAGVSLWDFLLAANEGPHSTSRCVDGECETTGDLAARVRVETATGLEWLGPVLRMPLILTLAYAAARICGAPHRRAAVLALVVGPAFAWVGPLFATGLETVAVGPFASPRSLLVSTALLLAFLPLVRAADDVVPSRRWIAALTAWAAPVVLVWFIAAPFGTRLLSPAWPALVTLVAVVWAAAISAGLAHLPRLLNWAPAGALMIVAVLGTRHLDGLGVPSPTGGSWPVLARLAEDPWPSQSRARALASPELARMLDVLDEHLAPGQRLLTSDGRLEFFYGTRVQRAYASRCADLRGFGAYILLTNPVSASAQPAGTADPLFWARCTDPRLIEVDRVEGRFVIFRVGAG